MVFAGLEKEKLTEIHRHLYYALDLAFFLFLFCVVISPSAQLHFVACGNLLQNTSAFLPLSLHHYIFLFMCHLLTSEKKKKEKNKNKQRGVPVCLASLREYL